jgi:hypothetical protein
LGSRANLSPDNAIPGPRIDALLESTNERHTNRTRNFDIDLEC